jgi:hypothetical protein
VACIDTFIQEACPIRPYVYDCLSASSPCGLKVVFASSGAVFTSSEGDVNLIISRLLTKWRSNCKCWVVRVRGMMGRVDNLLDQHLPLGMWTVTGAGSDVVIREKL